MTFLSNMKNTKYNIEYEEAPSGSVTFYNYKEPLMKFTEGYGFVGALIFDSETDKVQCHICGEWFGALAPHLSKEHNMKAYQYKDKVGLLQSTALISESAREKLIASGLDKRLQNLRKGGKKTDEQKRKISETLKKNAHKSENKNLKGTCPAQLIQRMQRIYNQQGAKFRLRHFDGFYGLIKRTFGSMKEACKLANIPYSHPGRNYKNIKVSNNNYSVQELIDFLKRFENINGRKPSYSDARRALIPSLSLYKKSFGSFKNALELIY